MSSAELPTIELEAYDEPSSEFQPTDQTHVSPRAEDVAIKQQRVAAFLDEAGYDAALLRRQDSFAWFTAGGDSSAGVASEIGNVSLFVTRDQRCVLANNVDSGRTFEEELAGLGFQLKECRWDEPRERLMDDICRGRKIACDTDMPGTTNELDRLQRLRVTLTELERQRLRELGRAVTHAVEATCRSARPGETELEVAAELSHRLIRHGIAPLAMYVAGEERSSQFRLPIPKAQPIRRRLTIRLSARRHGLCVSATRTVCFGQADQAFLERHGVCSMIDATYVFFSQPGELATEVLRRAQRIYEKAGFPHEWVLAQQGGVTGYSPCEVLVVPGKQFRFSADMAVAWTPSIMATRSGDTVLIHEKGYEIITPTQQWPTLTVSVKGYEVERPAVLVLDL